MKTIATINFKGGVGKTTVTWCLGDVLSTVEKYSRILLFDLDAQMSLTQALSLDAEGNAPQKFRNWLIQNRENERTLYNALCKFLEKGNFDFWPEYFAYRMRNNYHFVPSTEQLYWLELEHGSFDSDKGKFFIKNLLGQVEGDLSLPKYDFALFDCPPSFTLLSYSVLTCCDLILVPANPDFFAAKGIELLLTGLRKKIRPHPLPTIAVFANRVRTWREEPTSKARSWIAEMKVACQVARSRLGIDVHYLDDAWIPDRAALRDAITDRRTPRDLVPDFLNLWKEAAGKLK